MVKRFLRDFVEHLEAEDALTSIVKGQLYVESLLVMLLDNVLLEPKRLSLDRMTFDSKVQHCVALGLIHIDVAPALEGLAQIRNSFAHTLWPQFGEKEERDFLNVVRQSERLHSHFTKPEPIWQGYRSAIWAIWIYLFQQVCRTVNARKLLRDFWMQTTDASEVRQPDRGIPGRPLSPDEVREVLMDKDTGRVGIPMAFQGARIAEPPAGMS